MSLIPDLEFYKDGALGDQLYRSASGLYVPARGTPAVGKAVVVASDGIPEWTDIATQAELNAAVLGVGGAMTRISRQRVAGSVAATISFTSIPNTYSDLLITLNGRSDYSGADFSRPRMQYNGDTASNYQWQRQESSSTSSQQGDGSTSAAFIDLGHLPANGFANYAGSQEVRIVDYASTNFYKVCHYHNSGPAVSLLFSSQGGGWWKNTGAITRIDLILSNGNFAINTVATLWGIT